VIALLEFDAPKHDSTLKKIRVAFPAMKIRDGGNVICEYTISLQEAEMD